MSEIDFKALQEPFQPDEIEWRLQQSGEKNGRVWGICVPYVTNRAIQNRLDDVVGPAGWKNHFRAAPDGGVLCGISIRIGTADSAGAAGEWVTKWDGAENTDIEGVKGGLSASMKRSAVQWGIGRYLYALDESFANVSDNGKLRGKTKDGKPFRWDPPQLPEWALPKQPSSESDAESAPDDRNDHEAMLHFVRSVGPQVADDAEIRINRKDRNLKEFVRENWTAIKEQPRVAVAVVEAIERATGIPFDQDGGRRAA